jgi:DNA-binding transcriptional LysR family regulator
VLEQFDELEDVVQERQSELAGVIRITAPTGFGSTKLVEAIEPFQRRHPKVNIEMHLSDHNVSIIEEGVDLAIRFGNLQDSTMIARKLMDMRIVVFASPTYLAEYGTPKHPSALSTHNCLLQQFSSEPHHWQFNLNGQQTSYPVNGSFSANSPRAIAHMAATGLGIGIGPAYVVEPYIENGSLVLLFEGKESRIIPLHAVYPSNRHLTKRIRALIDHLVETLSGTRARI